MIRSVLDNILSGKPLGFKEAKELLSVQRDEIQILMHAADTVRRRFCGDRIDLCALINARSGLCPEDCRFCAQSARYETGCKVYPFVSVDKIVEKANQAKTWGANSFCIVISGSGPTEKDFSKIKQAIVRINKEVGIKVDCSLGRVRMDMARVLKGLGVDRYNHNLETSEDFYKDVCTTHSYKNRTEVVETLKEAGLNPCCGGIIGMGEMPSERIKLAFSLKGLGVRCVPINILNPRRGTPFEEVRALSPLDIIKTIAVFRFILPEAVIKIAGGREYALRDLQAMAFMAGANGMIIGGYLTTNGRSVEQDLQMVRDAGFEL